MSHLIGVAYRMQARAVVCPYCRHLNERRLPQPARQLRCRHCHKVFAVSAAAVRARQHKRPQP